MMVASIVVALSLVVSRAPVEPADAEADDAISELENWEANDRFFRNYTIGSGAAMGFGGVLAATGFVLLQGPGDTCDGDVCSTKPWVGALTICGLVIVVVAGINLIVAGSTLAHHRKHRSHLASGRRGLRLVF